MEKAKATTVSQIVSSGIRALLMISVLGTLAFYYVENGTGFFERTLTNLSDLQDILDRFAV